MNKGFFGNTFDFNGDGELDSFELSADFAAFAGLAGIDEEEQEDDE